MSGRARVGMLVLATLVAVSVLGFTLVLRRGFSAREEPSRIEAFVARRMRHLAVPRAGREMNNPVPLTPDVLADGRAHFADHCALCHGNDGGGRTTIGQNLYPKAPDMQLGATQSLSDGEIFYIIKNGVRLTGMPAWGADTEEDDRETWALVHFIRHLPRITKEELAEMDGLNPRSPKDYEEEQRIRRFLEGDEEGPAGPPRRETQHH